MATDPKKHLYALRISDEAHARWDAYRRERGANGAPAARIPVNHLFHGHYIDNRNAALKALEQWAFEGRGYPPRRNPTQVVLTNAQVHGVLSLALAHNIRPMHMTAKGNQPSVTYFLGSFLDAVIMGRLIPEPGYPEWNKFQPTRKPVPEWKRGLTPVPAAQSHKGDNSLASIITIWFNDDLGMNLFQLSNGDVVRYERLTPRQRNTLYTSFTNRKEIEPLLKTSYLKPRIATDNQLSND